ncbi:MULTISPECIES: hypothetical protein [unclassified Paenibacillus]|nr:MULTISPECIES: hypothetical protein [unclassified Paenibacillus]CAH0120563.1 hypothetical protein PAE9249_03082 [Paenibacillus sp. CECT 9249]
MLQNALQLLKTYWLPIVLICGVAVAMIYVYVKRERIFYKE